MTRKDSDDVVDVGWKVEENQRKVEAKRAREKEAAILKSMPHWQKKELSARPCSQKYVHECSFCDEQEMVHHNTGNYRPGLHCI
jgi:uncharacterized membrane-anchored protein